MQARRRRIEADIGGHRLALEDLRQTLGRVVDKLAPLQFLEEAHRSHYACRYSAPESSHSGVTPRATSDRPTCPTCPTRPTRPTRPSCALCHTSPVPLTRRDALRGLLATGVGAAVGPIAYGPRTNAIVWHGSIRSCRFQVCRRRSMACASVSSPTSTTARPCRLKMSRRAVEMLRSATPDLIVLGGDYVTFGNRRYVEPVAELLAPLADAPLGSFAVLGNHDNDREMAGGADPSQVQRVCSDERTRLTIRDESLDLVGIRFWTRRVPHLLDVMKGAGPNTILLAHDPRRLTQAAQLNVPLVLSGHTHGGQVLLPGLTAWCSRTSRPGGRLAAGQHVAVCEPRRRHGLCPRPSQLPT